jgi:hypothetical protein
MSSFAICERCGHRDSQHDDKGACTVKGCDCGAVCDICGEEECECHEIVTGFPGNCSKD